MAHSHDNQNSALFGLFQYRLLLVKYDCVGNFRRKTRYNRRNISLKYISDSNVT